RPAVVLSENIGARSPTLMVIAPQYSAIHSRYCQYRKERGCPWAPPLCCCTAETVGSRLPAECRATCARSRGGHAALCDDARALEIQRGTDRLAAAGVVRAEAAFRTSTVDTITDNVTRGGARNAEAALPR